MHRDPAFQDRIGRDILRYISEQMILAGEKSLDLLHGMILMITLYHVHQHNNPQLMNLVHLAKALLVDLGLNRSPGFSFTMQISQMRDASKLIHGGDQVPTHNLEDRRTALAMFHVSSKYATTFRALDPVQWTEHLEDCCGTLAAAAEYPSDAAVVALTRLAHLMQRYASATGVRPGAVPVQSYVQMFTNDMVRFQQNLPVQIQQEWRVRYEIKVAELVLFEPVINADGEAAHKVEALHACLNKVVAFFDTFLEVSMTTLPNLSFLDWTPVALAMDLLARLSFLPQSGWDLTYVRSSPGFPGMLDRMAVHFRATQTNEDKLYPSNKSVRLKVFCDKIQRFKHWYHLRLSNEEDPVEHEEQDRQGQEIPLPSATAGEFSDMLWQDMMIDWRRLDMDFVFTE